jgi:HEAT repeat protein
MFLFGPPNIDKLKRERKVDKLIRILRRDKRNDVRQAAAHALGQILSDGIFATDIIHAMMECLTNLYTNEELFVSTIDALLLSKDGLKALMEYIRKSYHDNYRNYSASESVRNRIIQVLTQTPDQKYSAFFYELLEYPIYTMHSPLDEINKARVHAAAIEALSKIGDKKAIPIIREYLDPEMFGYENVDPEQFAFVAKTAKEALRRYGKTAAGEVIDTLSDESSETRKAAADYLEKELHWKPKNISQELLFLIAQEKLDEAARLDGPVIATLTKFLSNPSYEGIRLDIVKTLARIGDKRIIQPLITIIRDKTNSPVVTEAAIKAVGMIGSSKNPKVNDVIAQELETYHRIVSAIALGKLGDKRAAPTLIAELKKNENVEDGHADDKTLLDLVDATQSLLNLGAITLDLEDLDRLAHLEDLKKIRSKYITTKEDQDEDEYGRYTVRDGYWNKTVVSTVDMSSIRGLAQQEVTRRNKKLVDNKSN